MPPMMAEPPVFHVGTGPEDRPYTDWFMNKLSLSEHPTDKAFVAAVLEKPDSVQGCMMDQEAHVRHEIRMYGE